MRSIRSNKSLSSFPKTIDSMGMSNYDRLLDFVACMPLATAIGFRQRANLELIQPREEFGQSENLLWMLTGDRPTSQDLRDFEACLILHMDDPDNPSRTALMHALKQGLDLSDAVELALDEHRSSLHHGAGSLAAKMVLALRNSEDIEVDLATRIERGERLYGLGHRIYRSLDPRARVLREMLMRRARGTELEWLPSHLERIAETGARILREMKGIEVFPNVDMYNALVYSTFGLPIELNTDLFAVSRMAGWMAHCLEFLGT